MLLCSDSIDLHINDDALGGFLTPLMTAELVFVPVFTSLVDLTFLCRVSNSNSVTFLFVYCRTVITG